MKKKDRIKYIQRRLSELYPDPAIPLEHKDAYTLLVSVILSAQCTDFRVNQISPKLFKKGDNPRDISKMRVKDIEAIIRPCGLAPSKAKAISKTSKMILEKYAGKVPTSLEELESLPGVGHKTASVVMSQAFGVPTVPVDTHIHRLTQRWGLTNGKNVIQTERDIKRLFPRESWNDLHLQIIYYGREHCTARGCDGTVCEICSTCFPHRRKPFVVLKA